MLSFVIIASRYSDAGATRAPAALFVVTVSRCTDTRAYAVKTRALELLIVVIVSH